MKPNILFITIDSLRFDRVFGSEHTSKTPNVDFLIKNGTNFSQTISTSDATGLSIGSIFSGCFPFQTGITHFDYNETIPMFHDILKKNNYFLASTVPDVSFFLKLTSKYDKNYSYVYDKRENWLHLDGGIGEEIIQQLIFLKEKSPWFYYIHLMDLHSPFKLPSEFNSSKFGLTSYDRMISYIDTWLGKFFEQVNFDETIIILSADHGDFIPTHDLKYHGSKNLHNFLRKCKKLFPKLEPLGVKLFTKIKSLVENQKVEKLKNELSSKDLRTLGTRGNTYLFDELLLIPLIISGKNIPKSKNIINMVRQVDIFPTILDLLKIPPSLENIHGQSLCPLLNNEEFKEITAYIETGSRNPKKKGKLIGVRTSEFKYLKSRNLDEHDLMLYDLQNDPNEEKNISNQNLTICKKMERLLSNLQKESPSIIKHDLSKKEEREIKEELKKLGYI